MKGIRIVATARALPAMKVSNEMLSARVDTSDEWIRTRTGIGNRYYCQEESCTSLAVMAAKQVIAEAGIDPGEIGAVLVATSTADYAFPSTACIVQQECGIPEDVIAFDISAACTGFLMGLATANGLFHSLGKPYILLVGAEELSRVMDHTDRSTCILFGDGAGAALLTEGEGRFVQKSWSRGNLEVLNCPGAGKREGFLQMKGNEVFRFAVTALNQAINEVLKEAELSMDDIDLVVCHQANERIIRHVQKQFPGHGDKFFMNISEYGNTSAASIPIALDECKERGLLAQARCILLVGFGAGLTWSAALLEEKA